MQTASNAQHPPYYLVLCLLILIPVYVLAGSIWRLKDSASALANYETLYALVHAAFMLLSLMVFKRILLQGQTWKVLLLGTLMGVLATYVALPLSTLLALDDGASRIANGYRAFGWVEVTAVNGLFAFYSYAWLLGASLFISIKWLMKVTANFQ
ncbi:hypothetical protein [Thiothrix eikelboomii]|uniref:Uncharacterized protein n=1 Tax=Thiothrix eikelboomii TaxID=92487 RepID=A0A1T4WDL8_9GAMM|nr:hypothetical protein [Thiothrix eikelboomii]SKA75380.1 hypothetical protein SAMN02745130_01519 [Thiothrix eikelboomii]